MIHPFSARIRKKAAKKSRKKKSRKRRVRRADTKFKIMPEPKVPTRAMRRQSKSVGYFKNVQHMMRFFRAKQIPLDQTHCTNYNITWKEPEPQANFDAKMERYEKAKQNYDKWYKENESGIKQYQHMIERKAKLEAELKHTSQELKANFKK